MDTLKFGRDIVSLDEDIQNHLGIDKVKYQEVVDKLRSKISEQS